MKKVMLTVSAFALVAMMAACGGSPKSDAEALAKKTCECTKLAAEGKDAKDCLAEVEKMAKEHEGKYAKDSVATKEYAEAFMAYKCEGAEKTEE